MGERLTGSQKVASSSLAGSIPENIRLRIASKKALRIRGKQGVNIRRDFTPSRFGLERKNKRHEKGGSR